MSRETFERGRMVGVIRYDFYSGQNYEEVYALFSDGTAQTSGYAYTNQGPHLTLTNVNRWSAYPDTYQP